jgi:hypothetical protein
MVRKSLYNPIDLAEKSQHPKLKKIMRRFVLENNLSPGRTIPFCMERIIKASNNRSALILIRAEGG